ncbi:MAG: hypothetical protein F6K14_10680 [Symploca sp. SIO2C1]|nr:hypothetical protein [Symploca sp. SIO2C1]
MRQAGGAGGAEGAGGEGFGFIRAVLAREVAGQLAGLDFFIDLEEFLHTNIIFPAIIAHQDSKNYDSSFL